MGIFGPFDVAGHSNIGQNWLVLVINLAPFLDFGFSCFSSHVSQVFVLCAESSAAKNHFRGIG